MAPVSLRLNSLSVHLQLECFVAWRRVVRQMANLRVHLSISILRQRERLGNVNFNMQLQHMYQVESDITLLRLFKKWLPRRAIIHKPQ